MSRLPLRTLLPLLLLVAAAIHGAAQQVRPAPHAPFPRAVVLDVGQGDAILLDGPGDGAEVLVDGGPDTHRILEVLRAALGTDRTIDLVVLTHPHADHVAGLSAVLEHFTVARVLSTGVIHTTATYEQFLQTIVARGIPLRIAAAGQAYDIGPFHLDVLAPSALLEGQHVENLNSSSIVLMTTIVPSSPQLPAAHTTQTMLLTGDAEADVEAAMLERYCTGGIPDEPCSALAADVLKVPHHGSQDSSTGAFVAAVAPQHAIISVGAENEYGHPHPRALKRLTRYGARLWRTDTHGTVTVEFRPDGLDIVSTRE